MAHIKKAAYQALSGGKVHYTFNFGLLEHAKITLVAGDVFGTGGEVAYGGF